MDLSEQRKSNGSKTRQNKQSSGGMDIGRGQKRIIYREKDAANEVSKQEEEGGPKRLFMNVVKEYIEESGVTVRGDAKDREAWVDPLWRLLTG